MSRIHGTLAYGVKITIDTPLAPSKESLAALVKKAETIVQVALENAVKVSLKVLPFVKLTITDSVASIKVEDIKP
jgi:hypothetical protein